MQEKAKLFPQKFEELVRIKNPPRKKKRLTNLKSLYNVLCEELRYCDITIQCSL